jgi:hypothetical protein
MDHLPKDNALTFLFAKAHLSARADNFSTFLLITLGMNFKLQRLT